MGWLVWCGERLVDSKWMWMRGEEEVRVGLEDLNFVFSC